jgi:hypothetical protein
MRIYLDTNIFSNIRNNIEYTDLRNIILNTKDCHTYFFSNAHLLDLKQDLTDEKYKDLDFIEIIVENNYLCKTWGGPTSCYLSTPIQAFNSLEVDNTINPDDLNWVINDPLFQNKIKETKKQFESLHIEIPEHIDMPESLKIYLENIRQQTQNFNILKLIKDGIQFYNSINTDPLIYKELRRFIKEHKELIFKENSLITETDIDEIFNNSFFKAEFLDYIEKNIHVEFIHYSDKMYYIFLLAFFTLNILGLDSEKNKKARFKNTFIDSLHVYYSGLCDVLVTEDEGIIEKGNIIFKKFNIDTKILKPQQFVQLMNEIEINDIKKSLDIGSCLIDDINNSDIIYTKKTSEYDIIVYQLNKVYFYYFNLLQIFIDINTKLPKYIILFQNTNKVHNICVFKDLIKITKKC